MPEAINVPGREHFELPEELTTVAYRSRQGECAWRASDVPAVLAALRDAGLAVSGIEVWLPTVPGPTIPTPFIYTWTPGPRTQESWEDWVRQTGTAAQAYVNDFRWSDEDTSDQGLEPFFNLSWQSEGNLEEAMLIVVPAQ